MAHPVESASMGHFAGVAFINFQAAGDALVVLGRNGTWTQPLPGAGAAHLRTPDLTAPAGPYRVLALSTPMLPEWHAELLARGVVVHAYLPINHFVVSAPRDVAVADLPFVLDQFGLGPLAKLEPGLAELGGQRLINVLSVPGAEGAFDAVVQAVKDLGATEIQAHANIERVTARLAPGDALRLAENPHVLWIDQHGESVEEDMDQIRNFVGATHVETVGGFTGANVSGLVQDTGYFHHGDFAAAFRGFCSTTTTSIHGPKVFGIVFGSGEGNPAARGMLPDAAAMFASYSSITRYDAAACAKANIDALFHTNSWGRNIPRDSTYDSFSNENDRVVLDLDVLMIQSMSNCGPQCARREAMAKNIISVGGLYHRDTEALADDDWRGRSPASTGPASDGRIKPELVGPYDAIFTTNGTSTYVADFGGTSGATPVVAGAVGLTHEMARSGIFGGMAAGETASPAAAKALLLATANAYEPRQVGRGTTSFPTPLGGSDSMGRFVQGWGLPDLRLLHDSAGNSFVADESHPLETGQSARFDIAVPRAASSLRVSLVWSDAPGWPASSRALVNDLDLVVSHSSGVAVYRGNDGLDRSESSLASAGLASPDRLNNNEQVFVERPLAGVYTVTVTAAGVNVDTEPATAAIDQPFALVAVVVP